MDILALLRGRVERLPAGPHAAGIHSVVTHLAVAANHFDRGVRDEDASAFTDAILRCNSAYEGSLKEGLPAITGG